MSTHDYPFGPQDPPPDFADRAVRAMLDEHRLEEQKPRRTGLKRGLILSLAAIFIGASAWAGLEVSRTRTPVVESPAVHESPPTGRAEATTPTRARAPEPREEPAPEARPAPRRQPVVQTTATPPTPPPPHRVHYPRCDCATGGELCGCIE
jgi:hypothetical protein